ncbi:MAG: TlpA family protein disulfide reductase [Chloroflexi bacterium]|nr:TlpA family protein disulfide reductase [Chloroflexota bacterium]
MAKAWVIGATWLACLLLVTGCAGNAPVEPSPTPTPAPTTTSEATAAPTMTAPPFPTQAPPAVDDRASDFRFTLFQGEDVLGASEMALSELEGRPLVLNFWARFCTPCWSEMPELQDFYEEYDDRVRLLGIDVGQFTGLGSHKDAGKLLDSLGITYPAGYTDDGRVVRYYQIRAMPTTAFITAEGVVFRLWTGSITREEVTTIVRMMLEEEQ